MTVAITTRAGKGSILTHGEMDANFTNLKAAVEAAASDILSLAATAAASYQPLDSDLTAIAALSTTAFGRSLLTQADAATARATLGAGTGNGTVTSASVTTANGVSASVANSTTTPAFTFTLGAITPSSINGAPIGQVTPAAGTFTILTTTGDLVLGGNTTFGGWSALDVTLLGFTPITVANLPPAALADGRRAFVTNAATTLALGIGTVVTGGGANRVPVYCDGTQWRYG